MLTVSCALHVPLKSSFFPLFTSLLKCLHDAAFLNNGEDYIEAIHLGDAGEMAFLFFPS